MTVWLQTYQITLLEDKKGSIRATYLEPLKGSIQNPCKGSIVRICNQEKYGTFWVHCPLQIKFHIIDKHQDPKMCFKTKFKIWAIENVYIYII